MPATTKSGANRGPSSSVGFGLDQSSAKPLEIIGVETLQSLNDVEAAVQAKFAEARMARAPELTCIASPTAGDRQLLDIKEIDRWNFRKA